MSQRTKAVLFLIVALFRVALFFGGLAAIIFAGAYLDDGKPILSAALCLVSIFCFRQIVFFGRFEARLLEGLGNAGL